ncbi:nucleotide-binding universal stress UspA family protein [Winogradskyella epiphytica]|uniref:Universal stress protein n=1 Tax=Winogradskyella epiphytica TaxID=262005 RepID=A0A2V4XC25_9FLAO|nr:universal stress protein [Winogradskyella epiphytica]PYE83585.1 nucleotide-binding universal stress UspA family protein [Winogradskyella epiphytica]GGW59195.1 universal stress protein [Winogradskyella epiphytica]
MKNILVAIDLKGNDQVLIDKATSFAEKFNSKVWIIHIAAPDPDFVGFSVGPQYIRDSRASELKQEHRQLERFSEALEKQGIASEGLLVQGATIEMILKEAEKLKIDLIISGYQDHGFFYKALYGSVSNSLIKASKIPVLIVPID